MRYVLLAFEQEVCGLDTETGSVLASMDCGMHTWLMKVLTTTGVTAEATVMVSNTILIVLHC
jgi:hypothetical protein